MNGKGAGGGGRKAAGRAGEGRVRLQAKSGVMARRPSSDTAGLVSVRRDVRLWMIEVCGGESEVVQGWG